MNSAVKNINHRSAYWYPFILFAIIFAFSLSNIDSDPSPMKRFGDVTDEGYWIHNARNKILFGTYTIADDNFDVALLGSPLFTIILRIIFSYLGVSYFSARLASLIPYWIILIQLFLIFRIVGFSVFKSTIPVLILGFSHQMLTYARWSTPILLEMMFLCSAVGFLIIAVQQQKNSVRLLLLFGSGFLFSCAIASKLSSLYQIPFFIIVLIALAGPLRKITINECLAAFTGFLLGIGLIGFFLFKINVGADIFFRTDGKANIGFANPIKNFFIISHNAGFITPSVLPIFYSVIMFFVIRLLSIAENITIWSKLKHESIFDSAHYRLSQLSLRNILELINWLWLICGFVTLAFFNVALDRRFVFFIIPMSVLSALFLIDFRVLINKKNILVLSALSVISIMFFCPHSIRLVNIYWLYQINHTYLSLFEKHSIWLIIGLFISFVMYKLGSKFIAISLIVAYILINGIFNYLWLANPTFTLRESSRALNRYLPEGAYFIGDHSAHSLAVETRVKPIFYLKEPSQMFGYNINFVNRLNNLKKRPPFFIIENLSYDSKIDSASSVCLVRKDFDGHNFKKVFDINLAPYPKTQTYRYRASVYEETR